MNNKPKASEVRKTLESTRRIAANAKGLYSPEAVEAAKGRITGLEDAIALLEREESGY